MKVSTRHIIILASLALLPRLSGVYAQNAAPAAIGPALAATAGPADAGALADPAAAAWQQIQPQWVALNRTPRLYQTEAPSELEIPSIEVRMARAGGKLLVRLNWRDATEDAAKIAAAPGTPAEGRFMKEPSEETSRFLDAAAIMVPAAGKAAPAAPSLQMGDPQNPVTIYYWNAARGPMLMEAGGRETTRRTGQSFPARAIYQGGTWSVSFELSELPRGTPLAFAVWNGSQQDRDGRKYFSVWHWLE
jgi:hypothetical protein